MRFTAFIVCLLKTRTSLTDCLMTSKRLSYIYIRYFDLMILKVYHNSPPTVIIPTKSKVNTTMRCKVIALLLPIYYVTLLP